MDEIDVSGIDDILRQASRLRADVKDTSIIETRFLPVGKYNCAACDEENTLISIWCYKCGHKKGESVKRSELLEIDINPQCNVYNTEQIIEDINSPHPKESYKPREINMAKAKAYGEITIFQYNQKDNNSIVEMNDISSNIQESKPGMDIFKDDDIILYGRGDNKKSKKKLYIKPLSTPSLIQNRDPITPNQLVKPSMNANQTSEKTNLIKTKLASRPNSASKNRPHSACRNRNSTNEEKHSYMTKHRPRSETGLSNTAVFERLYNHAPKTRVRSSHSSPHLLGKCVGQRSVITSTVALASSKSSSPVKLEIKSSSENIEEKMKVFKRVINKPMIQHPPVRAAPLLIHGYKTSLPRRHEIRGFCKGPRIANWTALPTEIWLKILRHISHNDLVELAKTSNYFYDIASDTSIWRKIEVTRKELDDTDLKNIGIKTPECLTLTGCHGDKVTSTGLRTMFRYCAESLKVFKMAECSGNELLGTSLLLHLSARCLNIADIYLLLCDITDGAVIQLALRANRLESVCFPQCSNITDKGLEILIREHSTTLSCLDFTGCRNITNLSALSSCKQLSRLHLGNCTQVSGRTLFDLAKQCCNLAVLDIRGCKYVTSDSIMSLLAANRNIHTLSLSHIPIVTDTLLEHVSETLHRICVLDLSGCIKITSTGIKSLVKHPIKALDLGCTAASYSGCLAIAHYLFTSIEELSFNFCTDINSECVRKIVEKCGKLKKLSIFGCRYIRQTQSLFDMNPTLHIDV